MKSDQGKVGFRGDVKQKNGTRSLCFFELYEEIEPKL